jgi:cation diffusion facilitator CzcD-associated flavoprotein CzcO
VTLHTIIVGSGFSGLGMAIALRKAGQHDFVVLEKADEVGGTWRDNHYPGCACDIPSHLYSYSFELNPDWSRTYAPQAEILAYLKRCADKYGVRPHIRFNTPVRRAVFDEASGTWLVHTDGTVLRARHLVLGVGALSRPAYPSIPGLERFQGARFHSAEWDHGYPLAGKRVAVIGTGASAIQFVPRIVPQVGRLFLFQRTPPWVLPRPDRPIGALRRRLFRAVPPLQGLYRAWLYWLLELCGVGFTMHPGIMKLAAAIGRRHLRRQVPDLALREKLTPRYTPGCKRILMANDYYPALCQPHVEVVTNEIAEVGADAVITRDGVARPVDAIIYGTGFQVSEFLTPLQVLGRGGADLNQVWRGGIEAYLGTTIAGFPNLFMLVGPNTGLGHNSMVFMIEAQIHYALRCMQEIAARAARFADVRPAAQAAFNGELQPRLQRTVWASGCRSWYLDRNGRNSTLWPGLTCEFWLRTRRLETADYTFGPPGSGDSP